MNFKNMDLVAMVNNKGIYKVPNTKCFYYIPVKWDCEKQTGSYVVFKTLKAAKSYLKAA